MKQDNTNIFGRNAASSGAVRYVLSAGFLPLSLLLLRR